MTQLKVVGLIATTLGRDSNFRGLVSTDWLGVGASYVVRASCSYSPQKVQRGEMNQLLVWQYRLFRVRVGTAKRPIPAGVWLILGAPIGQGVLFMTFEPRILPGLELVDSYRDGRDLGLGERRQQDCVPGAAAASGWLAQLNGFSGVFLKLWLIDASFAQIVRLKSLANSDYLNISTQRYGNF
jgi:hypothetical protein